MITDWVNGISSHSPRLAAVGTKGQSTAKADPYDGQLSDAECSSRSNKISFIWYS